MNWIWLLKNVGTLGTGQEDHFQSSAGLRAQLAGICQRPLGGSGPTWL